MSSGIDYSRFDNIDTDSEESSEAEGNWNGSTGKEGAWTGTDKKTDWNGGFYEGDFLDEIKLANGWTRVGQVEIHPDDYRDYARLYSETVLIEDPHEFTPSPADFEDGIVTNWGLKDSDVDAAGKNDPAAYAQAVMRKERHRYGKKGDPVKQFVNVLKQRKAKYLQSEIVQNLMDTTFYLKVSLVGCEKDVWRIFRVPAAIDLSKLQDQVLVPIMGWSRGYHGYVFEDPKDGAVLGPVKYAGYLDMMHVSLLFHDIMEDKRFPLSGLIHTVGDFIYCTYDLGDQWRQKIEVLDVVKMNPVDDSADSHVQLLDGMGGCPPEDSIGLEMPGIIGYADFLKEYKRSPNSSKMKGTIHKIETQAVNYAKPWFGTPIKFRPLEFDIRPHRSFLEAMLLGP